MAEPYHLTARQMGQAILFDDRDFWPRQQSACVDLQRIPFDRWEQRSNPVWRKSEIVVRVAVDAPHERHRHQQRAARRQQPFKIGGQQPRPRRMLKYAHAVDMLERAEIVGKLIFQIQRPINARAFQHVDADHICESRAPVGAARVDAGANNKGAACNWLMPALEYFK